MLSILPFLFSLIILDAPNRYGILVAHGHVNLNWTFFFTELRRIMLANTAHRSMSLLRHVV